MPGRSSSAQGRRARQQRSSLRQDPGRWAIARACPAAPTRDAAPFPGKAPRVGWGPRPGAATAAVAGPPQSVSSPARGSTGRSIIIGGRSRALVQVGGCDGPSGAKRRPRLVTCRGPLRRRLGCGRWAGPAGGAWRPRGPSAAWGGVRTCRWGSAAGRVTAEAAAAAEAAAMLPSRHETPRRHVPHDARFVSRSSGYLF